MSRVVVNTGTGKRKYFINGEEVTEARYFNRPKAKKESEMVGTLNFRKKIASDALAVHPEQIQEAMEHDKKSGVVGVEYLPDGRPVYTSEGQMRKAMKALKMHRRNCYY